MSSYDNHSPLTEVRDHLERVLGIHRRNVTSARERGVCQGLETALEALTEADSCPECHDEGTIAHRCGCTFRERCGACQGAGEVFEPCPECAPLEAA